ncbi:MAG: hypothetical protein C5B48_16555 [Candidatus Rokuibacteriota bacterium]|nr:MAG: hypothetical protein C5B48_16555 [Candidatus Rokubacteria bacterium]
MRVRRSRWFWLALPLLLIAGCASTAGRAPIADVESPYVDPRTLRVGQILHLATGRLLAESEALDYLSRFPVVYVGEAHDNADDHAVELIVLKAMEARRPGRVALGLEMLQRPFQPEATAFVRGEMSEADFRRLWHRSWSDFSAYRDILMFARERGIPLVALNASTATRQAVREHSLSALTPDVAKDVPDIDAQDPYHRAYLDAIFAGHAGHGGDGGALDAFHRVQLLWDETMAQTAAAYLGSPAGADRQLIVFAGANHVRYGFGVPRRLFRRLPLPFVILEPYVNASVVEVSKNKLMNVDAPALPLPPADIYWSVTYRDVRDEQVRLGLMVEDAGAAGPRVTGVLPDGPAQAAGVLVGDVIITVDGVAVKEVSDLTHQVSLHKRGDKGTLEVLRSAERVSLAVTYDVIKHGR